MPRLLGDDPLLLSDASDTNDSSTEYDFERTNTAPSSSFPSSVIPSRPASATATPTTAWTTTVEESRSPSPLPWTPRRNKRAYKQVIDDDDEDEAPFQAVEVTEIADDENEMIIEPEDDDLAEIIVPDYCSDADLQEAKLVTSVVELPTSTLISPRSVAVNYEPPLPVTSEHRAVDALIQLAEERTKEQRRLSGEKKKRKKCVTDFVYIDLDDFEVYYKSITSDIRLRSLHFLGAGKNNNNLMFFDGVLSVGSTRYYVERVPFHAAPVDNYSVQYDTVNGHISIHSVLNSDREVYYRLNRPSPAYARFYYPYLWVADLGKHFVDYADKMTDKADGDIRISHFRVSFGKWLEKTHPNSAAVTSWRRSFRCKATNNVVDFRPAVVAYNDYLWKEAAAVLGNEIANSLSFFQEVDSKYYPIHKPLIPDNHPPAAPLPTTVTPYIYHTFRGLAIQKYMLSTPGKHAPEALGNATLLPQGQTPFITGETGEGEELAERILRIRPGDVVSTTPDGRGSGSKWSMDFDDIVEDNGTDTPSQTDKRWYGLVHRVNEPQPRPDGRYDRDAQRTFDIAWLYAPQHTPCRQTQYPWANELFLSDHCTCEEDDEGAFIQEDEIASVHSVEWYGGPDTTADFFIRQTFLHGERSWIQLRLSHIFCQSSAAEALSTEWYSERYYSASTSLTIGQFQRREEYEVGDTVLAVVSKRDTRSEPYIIEGKGKDKDSNTFRLRVLLRRHELDSSEAPPNELVYTDEIIDLYKHTDGKRRKSARVMGRCIVRIFKENESIPTPYNRSGAGNVFYITHRLATQDDDWPTTDYQPMCVPVKDPPPAFRQGFNPATPIPRLRALELFCGCGNLGRGIEDAGATETRCANDIWPVAMHTFMANVESEAVEPFIGSADTLLDCAIRGVRSLKAPEETSTNMTTTIPVPGEIDFISGGSPCQGFSKLTPDKTTPQQFKNRSMVASFASFVDLYRPKYGILENVAAMAESKKTKSKGKAKTKDAGVTEDIFGQLVCALLGMGYQLRIMLGNAWFYGAPQKRQRVFLIFAAPGQQLPDVPLPSHGPSTQIMGGDRTEGLYKAIGDTESGDWITTVLAPPATAFPFMSSGEATADLESIDDGQVDICVPHPDHRITLGISDHMRRKIAQIPSQPYGLGLAEVRHTKEFRHVEHLFTTKEVANVVTNAYRRANPQHMFRTVRTQCVIADARGPGELHWRDLRPLSVMEMRRAQGVPDDDLLLFDKQADQWKMVGNAVARPIALALGLALREAYRGSLYEPAAPSVLDMSPSPRPASSATVTNRVFQTSPYAGRAGRSSQPKRQRSRSTSIDSGMDEPAQDIPGKRQRSEGSGEAKTVVSLADYELVILD
ncbi:modification methylase [Ophiostoma piceae UAMH 11346]|uniref:DNA (cytosine-5-)-methyltransferase n=1 Tax=Ophiostoma piceae (strain UAMH 11346) TaxID=1262450 RepID=S3CAR8_OPHP1|nr:modification methylase [Ophiostoma piceae UAMH 11346]